MSREILPSILLELLATSSRSGKPADRTLRKGLALRTRVHEGRREVLCFRSPGGAARLEADIVRRALEFPCADPVAFTAKRGAVNGWRVTEILPDEIATAKNENIAANTALLEGRRESRLEYALRLMLEVSPQHMASMWIVDCWREGLEQLGTGLEGRISELERELQAKKAKPKANAGDAALESGKGSHETEI